MRLWCRSVIPAISDGGRRTLVSRDPWNVQLEQDHSEQLSEIQTQNERGKTGVGENAQHV